MRHQILGLHHVTATVADAQADLDFFRGTLGLRLVKRTVNFDNHNVHHFYYGDECGTPGTIWTTFPYKGWSVPVGRKGEGQIVGTAFSVPARSLGFWKGRLEGRGVTVEPLPRAFGEDGIGFDDPSGLRIALVGTDRDARAPWTGAGMGAESAIHGLHGVTMVVRDADLTVAMMTELLGFDIVHEGDGIVRLAVAGDQPGKRIDVAHGTGAGPAANGLGTVHHVAMAIGSAEEQRRLREELLELGFRVTDVLDRQYFQSIYFREPGGVLFEVATVQPGFSVDEPVAQLGQGLMLPPWEEPNRAAIEAGLPRITGP